jgi:hypothetical protein
MSPLSANASLKEINAHKKKINWGEISTVYQLFSSSVGDLDGILTHGFDSAYKEILKPSNWNTSFLGAQTFSDGNIQVKNKPEVCLRHEYNDLGYELHCYPIVDGEIVFHNMINHDTCPFVTWCPERMQMLFRVNSLVAFAIYCYQNGDEADVAILKFSHYKVAQLITILSESFHITEVKGYSIAEFYREIAKRNGNILKQES